MPKNQFMKLDFDFYQDPKMLEIFTHYAETSGDNPMDTSAWECVGVYLGLCATFHHFHDTQYRIPLNRLQQVAAFQLHISFDRFQRHKEILVKVGLLKEDDGFLWSPRRCGELKEQDQLSLKRQEGAWKTNRKRWGYEGGNTIFN